MHVGPVLGRAIGPEDERVLAPVTPEHVLVDAAAVVLFAGGHGARLRITRVEEAGPVRPPFQRAGTRERNDVGEVAARVHVEDPQHALLAASLGHAVGQQAPVVARVVPVEGGGAVLRETRGIEEHPVLALAALTQVEDRLLLIAGPPLMEIAVAADGSYYLTQVFLKR